MSPRRPDPGTVWRGLAWILLLVLLAVQIWALYLLVPGPGEPYFAHQDKVGHAVIFGVPFALALVLRARAVAIGILLHALVSEVVQALATSTRTPDVWDLAADLVGIGLAVALVLLLRRQTTGARAQAADEGQKPAPTTAVRQAR